MAGRLQWDEDSRAYGRSRSGRYPGGADLEPEWANEVLEDPDLVQLEPDPKSRIAAARFIGESISAGRVLVVIAYRDLRMYQEGSDDGQGDRS